MLVNTLLLFITLDTMYLIYSFSFYSDDICNTPREDFFMCPLCDERCDFWYYRDTCNAAHVLFLFDNGGTVFFAAFMSLWGKAIVHY